MTTKHQVVSRDEWTVARKQLLEKEKALTRLRDSLAATRRDLPWVKVDTNYVFDTPAGPETLADLFDGRSQLIVYHFMFGPSWTEGCVGCSFAQDHMDGALPHLENHDVSYVVVSRAPLPKLQDFKQRMGWRFKWVSSYGSAFNYDFHVSATPDEIAAGKVYYNYDLREFPSDEMPGLSVFYKDEDGSIYHTYSAYARGGEIQIGTYQMLDITPKGRNETGPHFDLQDWVRHHDRYDGSAVLTSCCKSHEAAK